MSIATVSDLRTAISRWTWQDAGGETTFESARDDFIALGEARIYRDLKIREMEVETTLTTVAGTETVDLPTGFRGMRRLAIDTSTDYPLMLSSPEQLQEQYAQATTGEPKVFSIEGEYIRLRPVPDTAYSLKCLYWKALTGLSDSNTSNTILTKHPDLFLHASLIEAFRFLQDSARSAEHLALYTALIREIHRADKLDRYSGAQMAMRNTTRNP